MAEEIVGQGVGAAGADADFGDAPSGETQGGQPDAATTQTPPEGGEAQGQPAPEGAEGQTPPADPLAGTPFRDVGAVVDAYKNIQRLVAAKDQRIQQIEQLLYQTLQGQQGGGAQRQPEPEQGVDPNAWIAQFTQDPVAAIQQLVQQNLNQILQKQLQPELSGIRQDVSQYKIDREVGDFVSRNPEITEKDEYEILEVLKANPALAQLPDKLDIAWDRIQAKRARDQRQKTRQVDAVKDAKAVAGIGGKPSVQQGIAQSGDEFDALLDDEKSRKVLFGRS